MIMERPRSRCRRYCAFTCKHSIKLTSALLLPLLLAIFTVVITFEQRNDSDLQRQQDFNISLQARKQDMEIARLQREMDEKKREQDLKIALLTREHDRAIADEKRLADNLNAEKQRNMSRELDEIRYEQEPEKYFDALLLSYMNDVGQLLKENNGSLASNPIVGALARAKTLQVVRPIERVRSAQLVYFLYDARQLTRDNKPVDLSGAHFDNVHFSLDLSLRYISFVGTYLINTSFAGQDVSGADFRDADLTGANFSRADCTNATFEGATMIDVDCSHCDLTSATFHKIDFTRGVLQSASRNYTSFSHVKMETTNSISSFFFRSNFVESVLTNSDFRNASLTNVYFEYCDIENVDFTGGYLHRTVMNRSSLAFSTLVNSYIAGTYFPQSDLSYTNLSDSYCTVHGERERCTVGCVWIHRKTLSKLNTVLCDGTVSRETPLIRNGQVSCNSTSSLKDDWDGVSDLEPVIIRVNNSEVCVLGPALGDISYVETNVNISHFEEFIHTDSAVATIRARMSESVQIDIDTSPLNFQFHRTATKYALVQSKSFKISPGTTKLWITIRIQSRINMVPSRFNYIELVIAPRPPEL